MKNYNNDFYYLLNNKTFLRNPKPKNIIICNLFHLIEDGSFLDPYLLQRNDKFTYNHIQEYFMNTLLKKDLPMHFSLEFIKEDWIPMTGLPITNRSYFLEDLSNAGIIDGRFDEAILILVLDNWKYEIPTKRMYQILSHRIITPLMRQFGILKSNIFHLEELYRENIIKFHYRLPKEQQLLYDFSRDSLFFKKDDLNYSLDYYNKS